MLGQHTDKDCRDMKNIQTSMHAKEKQFCTFYSYQLQWCRVAWVCSNLQA